MTARFPWCPHGTCHCAARAMRNGATEADITNATVGEDILLLGVGFQRIGTNTMVLEMDGGSIIVMGPGSIMSDEAIGLNLDLLNFGTLYEIRNYWLPELPVAEQLHLGLLGYVAQELVSADLDAALAGTQQAASERPGLMTLLNIDTNMPPVIDNDTGDIDPWLAAKSLATRHHTEHIPEHA